MKSRKFQLQCSHFIGRAVLSGGILLCLTSSSAFFSVQRGLASFSFENMSEVWKSNFVKSCKSDSDLNEIGLTGILFSDKHQIEFDQIGFDFQLGVLGLDGGKANLTPSRLAKFSVQAESYSLPLGLSFSSNPAAPAIEGPAGSKNAYRVELAVKDSAKNSLKKRNSLHGYGALGFGKNKGKVESEFGVRYPVLTDLTWSSGLSRQFGEQKSPDAPASSLGTQIFFKLETWF